MKMYLISDNVDTLTGMRLAGVEGVVVHGRKEAKAAVEKVLEDKNLGILLITEKLSFESLKKTYLSLGQIDHYNLPEDIRTFYFRALQTKDANQKYEWAYFIFRLFKSEFEGTYSKDVQETLSIKTAQPQVGSASKSIDEAPEKYLDRTQLLDASIQVVYRNFLDAVNEINDIRVKSGVNPETIGKIIKLLSKIYKQSFNEFDRAIQYVKEFSLPEHLVKLNEVIPGKKINEYKLKSEWHTLLSEAHIILLDEILFLKNTKCTIIKKRGLFFPSTF